MASHFVDTNVFLRFLTNDDPVKAKRAEALFREAVRGKAKLATSVLVIAEIVWTLESFYKLEKADIATKVEKILHTPNWNVPTPPFCLGLSTFTLMQISISSIRITRFI
jgi:predicted nucleic-acid-binding protein